MTTFRRMIDAAGAVMVAAAVPAVLLTTIAPAAANSMDFASSGAAPAGRTDAALIETSAAQTAADCVTRELGQALECTVYQPIQVWAQCSTGIRASSGVIQPGRWWIPNYCFPGRAVDWDWEPV